MDLGRNPLQRVLGCRLPAENGQIVLRDIPYVMRGDILRQVKLVESVQQDMAEFYDVHWKLPGTYDNEVSDEFQTSLFHVMFPGFKDMVRRYTGNGSRVMDVGCGSGVAGRAFFRDVFDRIEYIGVDMSAAIEQAQAVLQQAGADGRTAAGRSKLASICR